jgi:hypothetical protein
VAWWLMMTLLQWTRPNQPLVPGAQPLVKGLDG